MAGGRHILREGRLAHTPTRSLTHATHIYIPTLFSLTHTHIYIRLLSSHTHTHKLALSPSHFFLLSQECVTTYRFEGGFEGLREAVKIPSATSHYREEGRARFILFSLSPSSLLLSLSPSLPLTLPFSLSLPPSYSSSLSLSSSPSLSLCLFFVTFSLSL